MEHDCCNQADRNILRGACQKSISVSQKAKRRQDKEFSREAPCFVDWFSCFRTYYHFVDFSAVPSPSAKERIRCLRQAVLYSVRFRLWLACYRFGSRVLGGCLPCGKGMRERCKRDSVLMGVLGVFLTQKSAIFHRKDAKNAEISQRKKRANHCDPLRTLFASLSSLLRKPPSLR